MRIKAPRRTAVPFVTLDIIPPFGSKNSVVVAHRFHKRQRVSSANEGASFNVIFARP